ncbi:MAG: hypothetical protein N2746_00950 [Deltaproteobacteria bacterium]|nr:hypothetical protein [Deltaproteobacteria bacterium]
MMNKNYTLYGDISQMDCVFTTYKGDGRRTWVTFMWRIMNCGEVRVWYFYQFKD